MIRLTYTIVLLLFTIQVSISQTLQLNLEVGKTYYHKSISSTLSEQEYLGTINQNEVSLGGEMSFKVLDKKPNEYNMEIQMLSIFMSMQSDHIELNVSSKNVDSDNLYDKMLKEMTRSTFKATMTKSGRVTHINLGDLYDNLFNSFQEIPEIEKHRIIYQLKQSFGEKALKGSIEMITAIFPEEPIGVSKEWTNQVRLETFMGADMINIFQLKDYNKDTTTIELNSKTKSDENNPFIKLKGELTRVTMNGTMKSTIVVDSKTGWIISSDMTQDFTGLQETKRKESSQLILKTPFTFKSEFKVTSGN